MKFKPKWVASALVTAIFLTGFAACGGQTAQTGTGQSTGGSTAVQGAFPGTADKNQVVLDITSEPNSLSPILATDTTSLDIMRHTMSGLTKLNANDEPVPDLAERWEMNEDNTMTTFYLRKDAVWSNGDAVTAQDFYYAWLTLLNPENAAPSASFLYNNIKNGEAFYAGEASEDELGVKVLDDYTLQVEWARPLPTAPFWTTLFPFFPLNQRAFEQIGADAYALEADTMVTNGPYRVAEWVHDDHILLEKVEDHYAANTIGVPQVKLVMLGDNNTVLNAFMAGELDIGNIYGDQIEQLRTQEESAVHSYIDGGSWFLSFNTENQYLNDIDLRKALAYSIDTQSLLDNVIKDGSVAANGLVPNVIAGAGNTPYAEVRGNLFAYDPEAAKDFFDKALAQKNLTAADIQLELMVNDSSYSQNQAAFLQQQWKEKLGLDVSIKAQPAQATSEARNNGNFDMVVVGWGPSDNSAMTYLEVFETGSSSNYGHYTSASYDMLIEQARNEGDTAKQEELMIEAEKLLFEQFPIGPLYFTTTTYASSAKVQGLVRTPFQYFSFLDGASIA